MSCVTFFQFLNGNKYLFGFITLPTIVRSGWEHVRWCGCRLTTVTHRAEPPSVPAPVSAVAAAPSSWPAPGCSLSSGHATFWPEPLAGLAPGTPPSFQPSAPWHYWSHYLRRCTASTLNYHPAIDELLLIVSLRETSGGWVHWVWLGCFTWDGGQFGFMQCQKLRFSLADFPPQASAQPLTHDHLGKRRQRRGGR